MNQIGSRSTFIANVCALFVAAVMVAEGGYIQILTHERPSVDNYLTHEAWSFFIPALVMFIIRNRICSWFFLVLYIALSIQMFFQARSIFLGTYEHHLPPWGSRLGYLAPFLIFFPIFCLGIYAFVALIDCVASRFDLRQ
jgi:hypothetical protein